MIVALLAVLASEPLELSGRCEYSDAVARFSNEASLTLCDTLAIDRANATATFDFRQRSWGSNLRVTGEMSGGRMSVTRVDPRHGAPVKATGTCEIIYRGQDISAV